MELTNEKYKFAIVKFPEEDDALGIIALCWIQNDGTTCLYPPVTTDSKRNKLLREEALPLQSWSSHKISLMKKYASFSSSPSTGMEVREMWSSIPPNSLTPRPSSFSNAKIPPAPLASAPLASAPLASAPLASAHCPRKEKSAPLDVERIWLILGQLQAAAASQSEEISQLNRKIDLLLARGCVNSTYQEADESNEQALNSLPLSSMEEFDESEEKLKQYEFKSLVVKLLATLGGKDAKLLMFNCMKRCLTSEIGMKFSYTGRPPKDKTKERKRAFCSTLLCAAIQSSVRKIFPLTTEEQFKTNIGHWLQQSKNRSQTPRTIIPAEASDF
ncbi:uncharacterized protein LOC124777770 isoform X3 [Schistocerca piceifrons]|nr:uncharacterized protein LOC124777770 isoform X3 [Schistocerca piceifrons]XP_047109234.1 uncharacterized protein LOC124777770 isoform X3 [Schistocerca piceifrons]